MAEKPPYTSVNDVDAFFDRVQTIAEPKPPKKIDTAWVESYGFETGHPSAIPSMLRWLGVVDDENESTGVWDKLRVDNAREEALGGLVRDAYKPLFDAVDVEKATARDLRGAFVSTYSIGDPARHIKCFLALCRHAGIPTAEAAQTRGTNGKEQAAESNSRSRPARKNETQPRKQRMHQRQAPKLPGQPGVSITLNVEIPAEWTEEEIRERIAAVTRAAAPATGDS